MQGEWPITRAVASIAWACAFAIAAWRMGPPIADAVGAAFHLASEMRRDCVLPGTITKPGRGG